MIPAQKSPQYPQVHRYTCHCHPRGKNLSQPSAFTVHRQQGRVRPKRLSHVHTLQPKGVAWEKCNERVELKFSPSWVRRNIHPNSYRSRSLRSKRKPSRSRPSSKALLEGWCWSGWSVVEALNGKERIWLLSHLLRFLDFPYSSYFLPFVRPPPRLPSSSKIARGTSHIHTQWLGISRKFWYFLFVSLLLRNYMKQKLRKR